MKIVDVTFQASSCLYAFKTDLDLQQGDYVVCDTQKGWNVGRVSALRDITTNTKATKWIIDKINVAHFEANKEKEKKMVELRLRMRNRQKKLEADAIFRLLAKEDAEMQAMLEEYDALQK